MAKPSPILSRRPRALARVVGPVSTLFLALACGAAAAQTLPSSLPLPTTAGVTPAPVPMLMPTPAPAVPTTTVPTPTLPATTSSVTQLATGLSPQLPPPVAQAVGALPMAPMINPQPGAHLLTFGQQMFTGRFAAVTYSGFNPGYQINIGDQVSVRLWGAVAYDNVQTVDAQGNLFITNVGPIKVQGVRNSELTAQIETQVKRTYRTNVGVYATLLAAQPVKVYVTGFVRAPGLYPGLSSDSVLYYLDRAAGIDPERGSYLQVDVLRNGQSRLKVDLYKFLLTGQIDELQLRDGDTIVVSPRRHTIPVFGNVSNPYQFEMPAATIAATDLLKLANPLPGSTHLSVVRAVGTQRQSFYYPLDKLAGVTLQSGDEVNVTADQYPSTLLVHVGGAQMGERNFVLPLGAKLKDLMPMLKPSPTANLAAVQLFRPSVAARQKESIDNTLNALQNAALTSRNATLTEAQTRQTESNMIMSFVERMRSVVPKGQVVLTSKTEAEDTLLVDGDTVYLPESTNLVSVSGEVQMPNTLVYTPDAKIDDYVALVGGFTQRADRSKVLVMRQNGSVAAYGAVPQAGDEIMVLPTIESKYIEVASGITSILYQLAISAKVLTGL